MYSIYRLINKVNSKSYIGVTNNYKKRMREHSYASNQYAISRAIRKYGWNSFDSEILFVTNDCDYAYQSAEKMFIEQYESNNPNRGYNLTLGGEGTQGYNPSEETRHKMRNAKQGKTLTNEHKEKISKANIGRKVSDETRKKLSKASKGRKIWCDGQNLTNEHKEKLSKAKAKEWQVLSPEGKLVTIYNMRKFCLENDLHNSAMSRVLKGQQEHHKMWKKP